MTLPAMIEIAACVDRQPGAVALSELLEHDRLAPEDTVCPGPEMCGLRALYAAWHGEDLVGYGGLCWNGESLPRICDVAVARAHRGMMLEDAMIDVLLEDYAQDPEGGEWVLGLQGARHDVTERIARITAVRAALMMSEPL
jgi:ribosomal protein S18 acetylase RimI-like enzyme